MRLFDLELDAQADLDLLARWEVMVVEGPRPSTTGATIVTIRSTRVLAERLAPYGFRALDHDPARAPFRAGTLKDRSPATFFPCGVEPVDSELFPPYDAHPGAFNDGLAQEMLSLHDGSTVHVESIAQTSEGRDVLAVRVGPLEGELGSNTPIVYVMATYHAREWATTAMAMKMLRETVAAAGGSGDPALRAELFDAAVVFVPVVNPDGYEFSRFTYRDQRKNRRPVGCADNDEGVDLNRNHAFAWGIPSDSIDTDPCSDIFIGDPPLGSSPPEASEPETAGIERMLRGDVFSGQAAAVFAYHSYATIGLYPNGLKEFTDAEGPRCWPNDNCMNPDLMTYRRLWGDTENPKSIGASGHPFPMDMNNNVIYTVSGDAIGHASYSEPRALAVTHEITDRDVGFYIECDPDRDVLLDDLLVQNLAILRDVLDAAPGLVSSSIASGYAPNQLGTWAPGMWVREASDGFDHDSARPRFVKPIWRDAGVVPPIYSNIAGTDHPLTPARSAAEYEAYMLDLRDTGDPWCLPCSVVTHTEGYEVGDGWDCSGCIDLTDPDRLVRDGWELVDGGDDYWWEPVDVPPGGATLEIGGGAPPSGASHCNLMFSTRWSTYSDGELRLERDSGSGWEPVQDWPFPYPLYDLRTEERLRSHIVEANGGLPGSVPSFRFVVPSGSALPQVRIYEPVIYCRIGGLP